MSNQLRIIICSFACMSVSLFRMACAADDIGWRQLPATQVCGVARGAPVMVGVIDDALFSIDLRDGSIRKICLTTVPGVEHQSSDITALSVTNAGERSLELHASGFLVLRSITKEEIPAKVFRLPRGEVYMSLALSPDGRYVAAASRCHVYVLDSDLNAIDSVVDGLSYYPSDIEFNPDSTLLGLSCVYPDKENVRVFDIVDARPIPTLEGMGMKMVGKQLVPESTVAYSGIGFVGTELLLAIPDAEQYLPSRRRADNGKVELWDVKDQRRAGEIQIPGYFAIAFVNLPWDGQILALCQSALDRERFSLVRLDMKHMQVCGCHELSADVVNPKGDLRKLTGVYTANADELVVVTSDGHGAIACDVKKIVGLTE